MMSPTSDRLRRGVLVVESVHRLTVSLVHMVPPTRRQVEVPSDLTLAGLHEVVQVLFDWDGDHLYEFVVGRRRYADPGYLDACEDDDVSLAEVAGRAGKVIGYTYDLGACWEHRIVVEAVEPARAGTRSARCVGAWGRIQPSTTTIGRDAWTLPRSTGSWPSSRCNPRPRLRYLRRLR
jgi:hypothetical protein